MQNLKLLILLVFLTGLFLLVGYSLGGRGGLIMALGISLVTQAITFWNSDKIALSMNQAQELTESQAPELFEITHKLTQKAALPMPKLYLTPETTPNAFATGRDPEHSAVALTQGLINNLNPEELEGVIAHELGHIKNRDVFISTVAAVLAGAISTLTQFAFFMGGSRDRENSSPFGFLGILISLVVAPIAAMIIQFAISRSREYGADAASVAMTGKPQGLASALRKLESFSKRQQPETLQPAFSSLYITNPFQGSFLTELMSTHPPIEKRIERILEMK
jgi:heat shock protein HtpX